MSKKRVDRFIAKATGDEICYLLKLISDKIIIPEKEFPKFDVLDKDNPVYKLGENFQLNTEKYARFSFEKKQEQFKNNIDKNFGE